MKKLLKSLVVLTVIFLFISCATFQTKREVLPGNIFSSKIPKLMLKIDEKFTYRGVFKQPKNIQARDSDRTSFTDSEYHLWSNGSTVIGILFKNLLSSGFYWIPGKEFNKKSVIQIKSNKIAGKNWKTGFWTVSLNNFEYNKLTDVGIEFTGDHFSKLWVRYAGEQTQIRIFYWENIDNNINTKVIIRRDMLFDTEMKFIEEFNKRADAAITFIK